MYGLWLYKEIGTEYGYCKVEIYRKGYDGSQVGIGALAQDSLTLALENLSEITAPIGKSVCSFSIIDTDQVVYDDFFTPDATALKVVVSTKIGTGAYTTRWSGYITPDFFAENLTFRTPISISARDNIGYLNDVDFDLTASSITVRELIQSAFRKIAADYPMSLSFVSQKQTAEGILAIDATISTLLLKEMSWGEALETILHDLGLQMRWVDNNTIAVLDLSQIPEYYPTQAFNFIHSSGYREIAPAWRQLSQSQEYGLRENFFEGWMRSDNLTFIKSQTIQTPDEYYGHEVRYYTPNNWGVARDIYTTDPAFYNSSFGEKIIFSAVSKDNPSTTYMSWSADILTSNKPLTVKFKAMNSVLYPYGGIKPYPLQLRLYDPFSAFARTPGDYLQIGMRFNLFLHTKDNTTYVMREDWVEDNGTGGGEYLNFTLDKISLDSYQSQEGSGSFPIGTRPSDKELTITANTIPYDGVLELRIYGYYVADYKFGAENNTSVSHSPNFDKFFAYINEPIYTFDNADIPTGQDAAVQINELHNVKGSQDYIFGEVPLDHGGINAYAGGLFKADGSELYGFQRNADGTSYNLLELVGREIIHFNKDNYNRLSGTIKNLDKEPLMFNRLLVREGKTYMPFAASLNVISNQMNITTMQEVEPYTTESFTEINSEVVTGGGATVGGGNNTVLQYSEEAGNAKRITELDTATEAEAEDAYVMIDNPSWGEAKKVHVSNIVGSKYWYIDEQGSLHTNYTIVAEGDVVSGGSPDGEDGEGGSGSGSTVVVTPILTSGEAIATIQVDGVPQTIYAPGAAEVDLSGYATEDYVNSAIQNAKDTRVDTLINTTIPALESDIAKRALQSSLDTTNSNVSSLQSAHNTLRSEFDALSAVLNDDVSGKINTWNEVVDFLDEYSGSQDLATILSGINADIAKRALQTDLNSAVTRVGTLETTLAAEQGYIDTLQGYFTNGAANNALKLGGQLPAYYATAAALATTNSNLTALTTRVTTAEGNITSISNRVKTFEDIIGIDASGDVYIKKKSDGTARNFYTYGDVISGGEGEGSGSGSGSTGGSTVSWGNSYTSANGLKIATITIDGVDASVYTAKYLSAYTNDAGYLTSVSWSAVTGKPTFATVATSGKYSDLSGTPTIPTSLKSPYALTFGSKTYDGSAAKTILASDLGALTAHQSIYALTIKNSAGTTQTTYTPNSAAASITLTKAMVGLGNVENTALSTWVGTSKITTLGTITTGTWNGTAITNAYINSVAWSKITSKPTTLSGYGITDAYTASTIDSKLAGYLPLSGGALTGSQAVVLRLDTTYYLQNAFLLLHKGVNKTQLGYIDGGGSYIYDYTTSKYLGIDNNGAPYFGATYDVSSSAHYILIHTGNISNQIVSRARYLLSPYSYEGSTYISDSTTAETVFTDSLSFSAMMQNTTWSNGWSTVFGFSGYKQYGGSELSVEYNALTPRAALRNYNQSLSGWTSWREFAFLDSNVASATKLQTARTIWGQSFDGSANVSGGMANVGHIQPMSSATYNLGTIGSIWNYVYGNYFVNNTTNGFFIGSRAGIGATDGGALIYTYGSTPISFYTGTERMRILGNGNVLIGTTTDNGNKLQVVGSSGWTSRFLSSKSVVYASHNDGYGMYIGSTISTGYLLSINYGQTTLGSGGSSALYVGGNGNVGIGTTSPSYKLHVAGVIYTSSNLLAAGEVTSGSDARYKRILSHAEIDINTIANAPIINFKWTDREDNKAHLGSTAQYWYGTSLCNGVIPTNDEKLWTMGYGQIALASVVSVAKKVVNHEEEIKNLKRRVNELENELEQYRRA